MKNLVQSLVAAVALALPASAAVFTFDGPGGLANDYATPGFSFRPAAFFAANDAFGDPIPGSETWRFDHTAPAITAENPSDYGRGAAPSGTQAMNALFQPVIIQLPGVSLLQEFGVTLDNDSFGDADARIEFYNKDNVLLRTLSTDQTIAGLTVGFGGSLAGVEHIILPAGAFYDDLKITVVPEPAEYAVFGGAALVVVAGARAWRRRGAVATKV